MTTTTANLGLFKYESGTDANLAFSITNALNNNWDKLDKAITTDKTQTISGTKTFTGNPVFEGSPANAITVKNPNTTAGSSSINFSNSDGNIGSIGMTKTGLPYVIQGSTSARIATCTVGAATGSTSSPVYVDSNGKLQECTSIAANKIGTATVGSTIKPVYVNAGVVTACSNNMLTATKDLAENGYVNFSNGLIINWGKFTSSTSGYSQEVTLPKAYTSSKYVVAIERINTNDGAWYAFYIKSRTTTKVTFGDGNFNSGTTNIYLTVGY